VSQSAQQLRIGCLVSGPASRLDAFSAYQARRSCPAMPYQTTGTPEAAACRSSRTEQTLPPDTQRTQKRESNLSHDGLNPASAAPVVLTFSMNRIQDLLTQTYYLVSFTLGGAPTVVAEATSTLGGSFTVCLTAH
jgi:hypothetical protein